MRRVEFEFELDDVQKKKRLALIEARLKDKRVLTFLKENNLDSSFVEQHIQMIDEWCEALDIKENCTEANQCQQKMKGYYPELKVEPYVHFELKPCACRSNEKALPSHIKRFVWLDADESYYEANLARLLDQESDALYLKSVAPVAVWIKQAEKGLYLYGPMGSGKTYLAMAILNFFAKKGQSVALVKAARLAQLYFSAYRENLKLNHDLLALEKAEVLVLDDLGSESFSSYYRDEILLNLLEKRSQGDKLTLFTSNLKPEALADHYQFNLKGQLERMKAERLSERIFILSEPLLINGRNRRR